ncbi:MAG: response regulator [Gammaproteobacteria bacterium]
MTAPTSAELAQLTQTHHPRNCEIAVQVLRGAGSTIEVAEDAREALEMGCVGGYRLVLMDLQMPAIDGLAATGVGALLKRPFEQRTQNFPHDTEKESLALNYCRPSSTYMKAGFRKIATCLAGHLRITE